MLKNNLIYKSYYDWWKNINKTVLFSIIILFGLGLFFSLVSTSLIASDKLNTNSYYFFVKHLVFITIGSVFIISTIKVWYVYPVCSLIVCHDREWISYHLSLVSYDYSVL